MRTFALRRLHEEGGRQAVVYCATEPACALCRSLGFRIHASLVGYSRADGSLQDASSSLRSSE